MKITSVDIMKVTMSKACCPDIPWNPVVVKINTDEGISGYGEIGLVYGVASNAGFGMAKDFAPLIIGMNPFHNEAIWEKIFRKTFWGQGNGSVVMAGISAIDVALWDIKGKALNVPCHTLLGGKTRSKLRTYASQIQFDWGTESKNLIQPEEYAEAAKKAIAEGYDCVKVDPVTMDLTGHWNGRSVSGLLQHDQLKLAVDRLKAIREVCGDDVDIIVELHSFTDTTTAVQLGRAIEDLNCFYYEEPVMPLNTTSMSVIQKNIKIPVASGERIYTRWGYRPFFEDRSLNVIQPDLGNCGGLTDGKKICDMGHVYDAAVHLHVCGGPLATAAALQLEAVIPNFLIHEHHQAALIPENRAMCKYDYQPKNGVFEVPDLPGIGQELSEEAEKTAEKVTIQ